ncbi:MAG: DNA-processing protein DprA [Clostridia bacterium]|nr:DNA-processing protein DprA [Clostridia bacterium]
MKNAAKWIWLAEKCGAGNAEMSALVSRMGTIQAVYEADFDTYTAEGASERLAEDLCDKSLDVAQSIIKLCQVNAIGILCYDDEKYPAALRSISNPPAVLYYQGILPNFNKGLFISVVGTRNMSEYGMSAAYKIAYEVACAGATVVSGMALGIDGVAAAAAIEAGGKTVAVLGCGIDVVYPKEHKLLKDNIRRHGVIISEFAPQTKPSGHNFPIRNRIISGLSQGTVVVDADIQSGAMITAKNAILQGKDIYAVPSNIDSENSSGTNSLIRDGAQAVLCGRDIVKHYRTLLGDRYNSQSMKNAELSSTLDLTVLRGLGVSSGSKCGINLGKASEYRDAESTVSKARAHAEKIAAKKEHEKSVAQGSAYQKAILGEKQDAHDDKREDTSLEVLASLSEKQRKVFDEMPLDFPVTVDQLTKTGLKLGEVIAALTVLEVKGLVVSLPGAIYMRK